MNPSNTWKGKLEAASLYRQCVICYLMYARLSVIIVCRQIELTIGLAMLNRFSCISAIRDLISKQIIVLFVCPQLMYLFL